MMGHSSTMIIGIDPGLNGGIAWGWEWSSIFAVKMPVIKADGKKVLDLPFLAATLQDLRDDYPDENGVRHCVAYVERVHAMPGQGVSSMFNFGMGYGAIQGILAALRIQYKLVQPKAWQTVLSGVDQSLGKKRSVVYCKQMHPTLAAGKITDGVADAACIVEYALKQLPKDRLPEWQS